MKEHKPLSRYKFAYNHTFGLFNEPFNEVFMNI